MIIVDANLLLYAYDPKSKFHSEAKLWLEEAFSGSEPVGISWMVLLAFLRIGTNAQVYPRPFSMQEAVTIASVWFEQPVVTFLAPTERHWEILSKLVIDAQVRGPLVMDADLAALALEHGATLYSTDKDFRRFPGLRLRSPLQS